MSPSDLPQQLHANSLRKSRFPWGAAGDVTGRVELPSHSPPCPAAKASAARSATLRAARSHELAAMLALCLLLKRHNKLRRQGSRQSAKRARIANFTGVSCFGCLQVLLGRGTLQGGAVGQTRFAERGYLWRGSSPQIKCANQSLPQTASHRMSGPHVARLGILRVLLENVQSV